MFNLKFSATFDNSVFQKYGLKPVVEDYYRVEDNVFCVADGVTRDLVNGNPTPYPKDMYEAREVFSMYPNPSGAFDAAKICSDKFIEYINKHNNIDISKNIIKDVVNKLNRDIDKINKNRDIEYLSEDMYCAVATGGIIVNDKLFCFSIGDCHITVFDEDFNQMFTTINNHINFEDFEREYLSKHGFDWNNPKDRILTRAAFRNNPNIKHNGKEVSFGALTGQKEAMHYVDTYMVPLDRAKYICAYSDGYEPIFANIDLVKSLVLEPEKFINQGKERTIVIYERID